MKLQGIDPEAAVKIMPNDEQRIIRALEVYETTGTTISKFWKKEEKINFMPVLICLNLERELLYEKINKRVDQMLEDGFINEVKQLKAEMDQLKKSIDDLTERFKIYYNKLKEKGGDISGLEL